MKGGHPNSGPPPDPTALRRDRDASTWVTLPAAGRSGEVPDWPLTARSPREKTLWEREWRRPQAAMWEANGLHEEVALYVRSLGEAERKRASTSLRTLVRQQQEALGLSLPGMARLHWRIGVVAEPVKRATGTDGPTAKDRWKVLDGGA